MNKKLVQIQARTHFQVWLFLLRSLTENTYQTSRTLAVAIQWDEPYWCAERATPIGSVGKTHNQSVNRNGLAIYAAIETMLNRDPDSSFDVIN